jgi:hypothetical protein
MISRVAIGAVLGAALAISAHAQTFDGTYVGTRTITHPLPAGQDCPGIGGMRTPIEFEVTGSAITLRYRQRGDAVFRGTIGPDGSFAIATDWTTPTGDRIPVTWSGRIEGGRLEGGLLGMGPGGNVCRGTVTARRRS